MSPPLPSAALWPGLTRRSTRARQPCLPPRLAALLAAAALLGAASAQQPPAFSYELPTTSASGGRSFAGIGALAGGGAAKLLYDYDATTREAALQFLFAPNVGAALQVLQIEVGGDGFGGWAAEACAVKFADDDIDVTRGTQLWLAAQARRINPDIVLYAVPYSWPRWLRQSSTASPFGPTPEEATNVAQYVVDWLVAVKATWGLDIDLVGVWKNPARSFTADGDGQRMYVEQLAELLSDERVQLRTAILCSDGDWSCATYANDNRDAFLPLVAAFGAQGIAPNADAVALGAMSTNAPALWSTELDGIGIAVSSSAITLASKINNATVFAGLSGIISVPVASGSYYLTPRFNEGIIQASSPWSGHWYATALAWAIAHTSRFVPIGWRLAPPNSGVAGDMAGLLVNGGTFCFAWSPTTSDFSLVIAKAAAATQGDGITAETATFRLPPSLMGWANAQLTVVVSEFKFETGAEGGGGNQSYFERSSLTVAADGSFTVELWRHTLVTVTTLPNADAAKGSYALPPPPAPFPTPWRTTFSFMGEFAECELGGPARFFQDIAGAFECVLDADWGAMGPLRVLRQAAFEAPISRWGPDTRPHTIVGDPQWTDMDLSVTFLLPWSTDAALIGVRVTTWNSSLNEVTMLNLPGVWVLVNTTGWGVVHTLSDASLAHPAVFRAHSPGAAVSAGAWHSVRLVARGDSLVVAINGTLVGRVDVPYSAGFPTAGFVGLGTADYEQFVLFNDLELAAGASTCSAVPAAGSQAFVEQCAAGSSGQAFSFAVSAARPPSGQFVLQADPTLCLEQNATGATLFVFAQPCNASEPRQLWNVETSIEDGPFLSGPVTSANNGGVLDIYYSNYADDTPVDTYGWSEQANQVRRGCGAVAARLRRYAAKCSFLTTAAAAPHPPTPQHPNTPTPQPLSSR